MTSMGSGILFPLSAMKRDWIGRKLVIARVSVEDFLTVSSVRAQCLSCLPLCFQNLAHTRCTINIC